jgi:hypothetical protein
MPLACSSRQLAANRIPYLPAVLSGAFDQRPMQQAGSLHPWNKQTRGIELESATWVAHSMK